MTTPITKTENKDTSVTNLMSTSAWTPFSKLTVENKLVFDEAIKGFLGAQCSVKTVSIAHEPTGTSYRFKCTAVMPPSVTRHYVVVEVFNPSISADPYITGIYRD